MNLDKPDIPKRLVMDDVTVLIPTLGRDILEKCLHSIVTGTVWPSYMIVVDQGANKKVADWIYPLQSLGIRVEHVRMPPAGVAAGRNRGMEVVQTRFVVETHDDCLVSPDWLESMTSRLRQNPEAVITGRVDQSGEGVAELGMTSPIPATYTRFPLKGCPLYSANMGVARNIFNRVGGRDESDFLRFAEDNDWAYRALRIGLQVIYSPDVVLLHHDWRSEAQLTATLRGYARCQGGFYGKHLRKGDIYIALLAAVDFARGVRRWIKGVVRSDFAQTASGKSYVTQLFPGILAGLKGKK